MEVNEIGIVCFGYGIIKKIINYRLVVMLDILFWVKRKELRILDDCFFWFFYIDEDEEIIICLGYYIKDLDCLFVMKVVMIDFIR